jgi:hypothetical protein
MGQIQSWTREKRPCLSRCVSASFLRWIKTGVARYQTHVSLGRFFTHLTGYLGLSPTHLGGFYWISVRFVHPVSRFPGSQSQDSIWPLWCQWRQVHTCRDDVSTFHLVAQIDCFGYIYIYIYIYISCYLCLCCFSMEYTIRCDE